MTATVRKYSLRDMEAYIAEVRSRQIMFDGSVAGETLLLLRAADHQALESVQRFFTWVIPHELSLRSLRPGTGRRRA